jgi:hypothetical protein
VEEARILPRIPRKNAYHKPDISTQTSWHTFHKSDLPPRSLPIIISDLRPSEAWAWSSQAPVVGIQVSCEDIAPTQPPLPGASPQPARALLGRERCREMGWAMMLAEG